MVKISGKLFSVFVLILLGTALIIGGIFVSTFTNEIPLSPDQNLPWEVNCHNELNENVEICSSGSDIAGDPTKIGSDRWCCLTLAACNFGQCSNQLTTPACYRYSENC
jgi:hypothetical protein